MEVLFLRLPKLTFLQSVSFTPLSTILRSCVKLSSLLDHWLKMSEWRGKDSSEGAQTRVPAPPILNLTPWCLIPCALSGWPSLGSLQSVHTVKDRQSNTAGGLFTEQSWIADWEPGVCFLPVGGGRGQATLRGDSSTQDPEPGTAPFGISTLMAFGLLLGLL